MGILDTIFSRPKVYENAEPNTIEKVSEVSIEEDLTNGFGVDLIEATPFKVNRTIINCRNAANDSQVKGILTDTITKTNGVFEIKSSNPKAQKYIEKRCEEWNISQLIDDMLYKGMVDGEGFLNTWVESNKVQFRWLAFDAKNYRIKRIYDEYGRVIGYKQLTIHNRKTNKGWNRKRFDALVEDNKEYEVNFELDEIINIKYMERDGKGHSIVMDILDDVYYKRVLKELMVSIPYKNNNIIQVTMGNEVQPGKRLSDRDRKAVEKALFNYHLKGVVTLPFGYETKVLKGGSLPDIPSYLKFYESCIYVGLNTPEAIFSSESSNRATADIQLDSPTTGRVLFLQYNQEWVKKYIEKELFRKELDLNGFEGVEVTIEFEQDTLVQTPEDNDESNHKPIKKVGATDGKSNTNEQ